MYINKLYRFNQCYFWTCSKRLYMSEPTRLDGFGYRPVLATSFRRNPVYQNSLSVADYLMDFDVDAAVEHLFVKTPIQSNKKLGSLKELPRQSSVSISESQALFKSKTPDTQNPAKPDTLKDTPVPRLQLGRNGSHYVDLSPSQEPLGKRSMCSPRQADRQLVGGKMVDRTSRRIPGKSRRKYIAHRKKESSNHSISQKGSTKEDIEYPDDNPKNEGQESGNKKRKDTPTSSKCGNTKTLSLSPGSLIKRSSTSLRRLPTPAIHREGNHPPRSPISVGSQSTSKLRALRSGMVNTSHDTSGRAQTSVGGSRRSTNSAWRDTQQRTPSGRHQQEVLNHRLLDSRSGGGLHYGDVVADENALLRARLKATSRGYGGIRGNRIPMGVEDNSSLLKRYDEIVSNLESDSPKPLREGENNLIYGLYQKDRFETRYSLDYPWYAMSFPPVPNGNRDKALRAPVAGATGGGGAGVVASVRNFS